MTSAVPNPGAPPEHVPAPGLAADAIDPLTASMSTTEPRRTEIRPIDPPLYSLAPIGAAAAVTATQIMSPWRSLVLNEGTYVLDRPAPRSRARPRSPSSRPMFEMARAGKTQTAIARELNEAGHRTAQGNLWRQPKVGQVLANPIWVGKLVNAAGTHDLFDTAAHRPRAVGRGSAHALHGRQAPGSALAAVPARQRAAALRVLRLQAVHPSRRDPGWHPRALPLHGTPLRGHRVQAARRPA